MPAFDLGVFPAGNIVHDRYFYMASLGASWVLGLVLGKLATGSAILGLPKQWLAALLVLLALLSFGTVHAMAYWGSDYEMLDHAMLFSPNDLVLRNLFSVNLALQGRAAYLRGDWTTAEMFLKRAKSVDPVAADNYLQLGMVDLNTKRPQDAEQNFREAIALRPTEPMFHFALGVALTQQKNCADARPQFARALELQPGFPGAQQQMDACEP